MLFLFGKRKHRVLLLTELTVVVHPVSATVTRKSSCFMLMLQMFNVCFPVMILINGETLSEEPAQPVSDLVGQ